VLAVLKVIMSGTQRERKVPSIYTSVIYTSNRTLRSADLLVLARRRPVSVWALAVR